MPNWCEGKINIRGKLDDIERFLKEGLEPCRPSYHFSFDVMEDEIEISIEGDWWIKDSKRAFITDTNGYVIIHDDKTTINLNVKQAWYIEADDFLDIARRYNLDLNIFAFDRGMEFSRRVMIVNGEIEKDEAIGYKDWNFECIHPELGG